MLIVSDSGNQTYPYKIRLDKFTHYDNITYERTYYYQSINVSHVLSYSESEYESLERTSDHQLMEIMGTNFLTLLQGSIIYSLVRCLFPTVGAFVKDIIIVKLNFVSDYPGKLIVHKGVGESVTAKLDAL